METFTSRVVTTQNDKLSNSDEVVVFDADREINFIVGASSGDGRQVYLKNISEHNVVIRISGLQDLNVRISGLQDLIVPRMNTGTYKRLYQFNCWHLLAYSAGKWVII